MASNYMGNHKGCPNILAPEAAMSHKHKDKHHGKSSDDEHDPAALTAPAVSLEDIAVEAADSTEARPALGGTTAD
jgi:hypothetical protein